jgi:hypothetical protein
MAEATMYEERQHPRTEPIQTTQCLTRHSRVWRSGQSDRSERRYPRLHPAHGCHVAVRQLEQGEARLEVEVYGRMDDVHDGTVSLESQCSSRVLAGLTYSRTHEEEANDDDEDAPSDHVAVRQLEQGEARLEVEVYGRMERLHRRHWLLTLDRVRVIGAGPSGRTVRSGIGGDDVHDGTVRLELGLRWFL